ncbi:ABC transporter ATP-binding protein [Mollicutes bacterium LVI A0078]|nr:ABC transporter ATP-binding protein [Mollicutes bacterium LVI A0078]
MKTLSGGQKQLVYLLISLSTNYELYLIDEPFNNLDKDRVEYIKALIMSKNNVLIIDHLNLFDFKPVYIEKRGFSCEH